jgi:putative ABC transport system permease protein
MKFLGLVWSNLKRKKLRTSLTLLSILVAFLLFACLCAIKQALTGGIELAGADRLITRNKVSLIQPLPLSYEQRIAGVRGVAATAHQSWFGGIYQDPKNFFATIPVEPEKFLAMYPEYILPPAQKEMWLKTRNGAIIGRTLAQRFKPAWKIGDRIPLTCPIWGEPANQPNWEFEIVGIFEGAKKATDTSGMFFRYDYFDEARTRGKGQIGWLGVRVQNPDQAAEIASKIDEEFANSPYETKTEPEGAFFAGFAQQLGDIGTIMIAVVSAVFFTILLVAGNTMSQSVRERTEEIGVLKAMGFTNELVLVLVLLESCVVAAVGGLAGLGIGWLITSTANPVPNILPNLFLPTRDLLLGLVFVVALGIIAGTLPAVQAMRLRIAVALRRNG